MSGSTARFHLNWSHGIEVLGCVKKAYPTCPVVMFTASGDQELAVAAMKAGLDDYVVKGPRHFVRLPVAVRTALERAEERRRLRDLESREEDLMERANVASFRLDAAGAIVDGNAAFHRLVGAGGPGAPAMAGLRPLVAAVRAADAGGHGHEVVLGQPDGTVVRALVTGGIGRDPTGAEIMEGIAVRVAPPAARA